MNYDKRCPDCNTVRPLSDFHRRKDTTDGRQYICAACVRIRRLKRAGADRHRRQQDVSHHVPLYVRVDPELKQKVADYAAAHGISLARAVDGLLHMSLHAIDRRLANAGRTIPPEIQP